MNDKDLTHILGFAIALTCAVVAVVVPCAMLINYLFASEGARSACAVLLALIISVLVIKLTFWYARRR